jgi:inosine-uridine nucleoside N-ribohydrolase
VTSLKQLAINLRFAVLASAAVVLSLGSSATKAAPWIIDTDMGADDWIAILYTSGQIKGDIKAITVAGNGLSHCPAGRDNASGLLQLTNQGTSTPIGCGSETPLDGFASYPQLWRQGSDAMMGQKLPEPTQKSRDAALDSSALLAQALRQSNSPVSLLMLGTMTNLASVLTAEPELKSKIKELVAMAGAVDVPGNVRVHNFTEDNLNTKAEWNLYIDPVAARIVFNSGIPMRLVPLDVTNSIPLTPSFVQRFKRETRGAAAAAVSNWFSQLLKPDLGEYFHWDPLAAVVALNPDLCTIEIRRLLVLAEPDPNPQAKPYGDINKQPLLNWQGKPRNVLNLKSAGALVGGPSGKPVMVCAKVDPKAFEDRLIQGFQF